jgi:hypothetical protein
MRERLKYMEDWYHIQKRSTLLRFLYY